MNKELVKFLREEALACEETALQQHLDEGAPIDNIEYVADIRSAANKLSRGNSNLKPSEREAINERLEYLKESTSGKNRTLAIRQAAAFGFRT